jgi:multidrug transporter EmrE-like cation transporter
VGAESLKNIFFILILIAVALEALADILFKKWAQTNHTGLIIAGLIIYFIGTIAWAFSLKYEYLSRAITIFSILNLIIVVLVGVFLFKEDLSLVNKIGIVLGIISVVMLEI